MKPKRSDMVFVLDRSNWALRNEVLLNHVFRLGDYYFVPTFVMGDLVIARPYCHYLCYDGMIKSRT